MSEAALSPGGQVGSYTLVEKLRDGGMASLYLAKRSGVHGFTRPVAIKVAHSHLSAQPDFVQMFVDEAILSSHLHHPNIVHVEEFGELDDGRCFLAMEYIDGCSLYELSRHQRTQGEQGDVVLVTHIAAKVAEALQAAHDAVDGSGAPLGVVHRDVSPGNILLSLRGHVKVVDFGIAQSSLRAEHTMENLKGKIRYMSPEQAEGRPLDVRTDVYSLALVVWELLTGCRVFDSQSDMALLHDVRDPKIAPPSTLAPAVPQALDQVLLQALAKQPDDRFASAMEFARALRMAVPEAAGVEASRVAELVASVPQRNVDRTTMTGSGTPSSTPGSSAGSLVPSIKDLESVSGPRPISRSEAPGPHPPPLGSGTEYPIDVSVPADQRKRAIQIGVVSLGILLGVVAAVVAGRADEVAEAPVVVDPPAVVLDAPAQAPEASAGGALPTPPPAAVTPPTEATAAARPLPPRGAPSSPAPMAAPSAPFAPRGQGATSTRLATEDSEATGAPREASQTRVGNRLMAGEVDEGPPSRRETSPEARRVGGVLLAE